MRISNKNIYLVWALVRAWIVLSGMNHLPYPYSEYLFNDVKLYDWWAGNIQDGHFPMNDPMWQYPPLAAVIFVVGYTIARNMVGFITLALLSDFVLQHILIRKGSEKNNLVPAKIWLITPLLIGPIFLGRFDVFPTMAACIALLYIDSEYVSGFWLAIGTLLKVWPGLGLISIPRQKFRKNITGFIITSIGFMIALEYWWADNLNFISEQRDRGLQIESVGALPYMWANAGTGTTTSAFQFGAVEVVANGTKIVSTLLSLIFLVFLVFIVMLRIAGTLDRVPASHVMLLVVLVSMLTSRVLSPQYNIWILGLLAVVAINPMPKFRSIARLIFISAFCGQILYPWLYLSFQQGGVIGTVVHTIRIFALIGATFLTWRATVGPDRVSPKALANV